MAATNEGVLQMADEALGLTGIVLAGGRSSRMGRDKATMELVGLMLIERVVAVLDSFVQQVVVVRAPGQSFPLLSVSGSLTVVEDPVEGQGPLVGMAVGLAAAESRVSIVVGVDHPFLQPDLLRLLASRVTPVDRWVLPVAEGRPQPLCSAFASDAASVLQAHVDRGDRAPMAVAPELGLLRITEDEWRMVDPEGMSFVDVDTPEEFEAARLRIERR